MKKSLFYNPKSKVSLKFFIKNFFNLLKPFKWPIILNIFLIFLSSLFKVFPNFLVKELFDKLFGLANLNFNNFWDFITHDGILYIMGLVFLLKILQLIVNILSQYLIDLLQFEFQSYLLQKILSFLLFLPMSFFDENEIGKVSNGIIRGVETLKTFVFNAGFFFIPTFLNFFISFCVIIYLLGIRYLFASFIFIFLYVFFVLSYIASNLPEIHKKYEFLDKVSTRFIEFLQAIPIVKVFRRENYEKNKIKDLIQKAKKYHLESRKPLVIKKPLSRMVLFLYFIFTFLMTLDVIFIQKKQTISIIYLIFLLFNFMTSFFLQLEWLLWSLREVYISSDYYMWILKLYEKYHPTNNKALYIISSKDFIPDIRFEHVKFSYKDLEFSSSDDKKKFIFKDLNFKIYPKKVNALVGVSGAGKSSIFYLILKFYKNYKGNIFIQDRELRTIDEYSLREQIGYVSQDPFLFSDTLYENIRYGNLKATKKDIEKVIEMAYMKDFIKTLPNGLYTKIGGEDGVKLSGGQKQRIALARAMLKDPKLILLDEATSALDSQTELFIKKSLDAFFKGRTAFIIAHRLSTIMDADNILVIDEGKVVEQGTHEELLKNNHIYSRFFKIQKGDVNDLDNFKLV